MKLNDFTKVKFNGEEVAKIKFNDVLIFDNSHPNIPGGYLTFESEDNLDFDLRVAGQTKNWNGILEYSTDTTNWTEWLGKRISSSNGKLYLRGINNTHLSGANTTYRWMLDGDSTAIQCNGNIENLLDYRIVAKGKHPTMDEQCYYLLFSECNLLTKAPTLPATKLTNYCYNMMFNRCTSLREMPILPATELASYCYNSMFSGCTALTSSVELPATEMKSYSYQGMFSYCTSLVTPPSLPITTLAYYCLSEMFKGCTSLTTLPKLMTLDLQMGCYNSLFKNCGLIKVSKTQTDEYQYEWRIPTTGKGNLANAGGYWNTDVLEGTSGTFTGDPQANTIYYTNNQPI